MRQRLEAATAEKLFKFSKLFDFPTPFVELQMDEMEHVTQTRSVQQGVEHHQDPAQVHLVYVAFSPWLVVEPARQTTPMQQSPLITSILMQIPALTPSVKPTQTFAG